MSGGEKQTDFPFNFYIVNFGENKKRTVRARVL